MKVFVDSSALYAYLIDKDEFHKEAIEFLSKRPELITSSVVLHEIVAIFTKRISKSIALKLGALVFNESLMKIVIPNRDEEKESWNLYQNSNIGKISWVDCNNVVIMKRLGLKEIFSFDSDFEKLGLKVVP